MTCKERDFKIGDIVCHFKGKLYKILCFAEHTETGDRLVVYEALYAPYKTYARPENMFCSPVDSIKYPNASQKYRFEKLEDGCDIP